MEQVDEEALAEENPDKFCEVVLRAVQRGLGVRSGAWSCVPADEAAMPKP